MGSVKNIQRPLQVFGPVQIEKGTRFFRPVRQTALPFERHNIVEPASVKGHSVFKPAQGRRFVHGGKGLWPAADRINIKRGKGVGVRLGIKTTGCSGLSYKLEYVDDVVPEDVLFEERGVKLMIDPKSLAFIDGTELDYVRDGLNEGFRFNNPNERDRCGCGESFRV